VPLVVGQGVDDHHIDFIAVGLGRPGFRRALLNQEIITCPGTPTVICALVQDCPTIEGKDHFF